MEDSALKCPICLNFFDVACDTSCGHSFCAQCILDSLRRSRVCPVCRRPVTTVHPAYSLRTIIDARRRQGGDDDLPPFPKTEEDVEEHTAHQRRLDAEIEKLLQSEPPPAARGAAGSTSSHGPSVFTTRGGTTVMYHGPDPRWLVLFMILAIFITMFANLYFVDDTLSPDVGSAQPRATGQQHQQQQAQRHGRQPYYGGGSPAGSFFHFNFMGLSYNSVSGVHFDGAIGFLMLLPLIVNMMRVMHQRDNART